MKTMNAPLLISFFIFFSHVLLVSCSIDISEKDFENFLLTHGKAYADPVEREKRFSLFKGLSWYTKTQKVY